MKRVFVLGSVLLVGLASLVAVSAEQGERLSRSKRYGTTCLYCVGQAVMPPRL